MSANTQTIERKTYSVETAAAMLGISRALAYQLVRTGEIPSLKLGRRVVVPHGALAELLDVHPRDHVSVGEPSRLTRPNEKAISSRGLSGPRAKPGDDLTEIDQLYPARGREGPAGADGDAGACTSDLEPAEHVGTAAELLGDGLVAAEELQPDCATGEREDPTLPVSQLVIEEAPRDQVPEQLHLPLAGARPAPSRGRRERSASQEGHRQV